MGNKRITEKTGRNVASANIAELPKSEVFEGVWLQPLLSGKALMMTRVTARKGAVFPEHRHPHEQTGYVVAGLMELTIEGRSHVLGPGSTYFVQGDQNHSAVALEDFEVIDAFSPPRDDYLKLMQAKS